MNRNSLCPKAEYTLTMYTTRYRGLRSAGVKGEYRLATTATIWTQTSVVSERRIPRPRDASEGKGPQSQTQKRLGRRLEEAPTAVGGGYCRLQIPLRLALVVRGTVAGHRLGALEGGGDTTPPFQCIPAPNQPVGHRGGRLGGGGHEMDVARPRLTGTWGGGGMPARAPPPDPPPPPTSDNSSGEK